MNMIAVQDMTRAGKIAALIAGVVGVSDSSAMAADTYYSGLINSNNVVGWNPAPTKTASSFDIDISGGRSFKINAGTYAFFTNYRLLFVNQISPLPASTFAVGVSSAGALARMERFAANDKFTTAAAFAKVNATVAALVGPNAVGGTTGEESSYLLFKFEDSGTDYYGWVSLGINVTGNFDTGTAYIRINSYAWQSSALGVLAAGVVPVPEPSTVVTSGIAALAGGAVALRRWRKDRKPKTEAA